jgi:hypothetical protein
VLLLDVVPAADAERRHFVALPQRISSIFPPEARVGVFRYAWVEERDVPVEGRLASAFEQAMPAAHTLAELEAGIAKRSREVSSTFANRLQYLGYLPDELRDLTFGAQ